MIRPLRMPPKIVVALAVSASAWITLPGLVAPAGATGAVSPASQSQAPMPLIATFAEETASSGLAHVFEGDWEYMVGGGVATFDCNGDQLEDMVLAGGSATAALYLNRSPVGGALAFEKQASSGVELDAVLGVYPLDFDGDGAVDLALLRFGENVVLKGDGACRFTRANEDWGFDGGDAWSTAFAATWEKDAGWPTIAIGNYVDRYEEFSPWGSCTENWLHRPEAATERRFAAPLPLTPSHCPLSILFTDWNRSGTPSLRVSNDREYYEGGEEQMWRVEPGKAPALYTAAEGWKRLRIWGMGIASTDLDGDLLPDYFMTSMADNKLQTLEPQPAGQPLKPTYKDIAWSKGVTLHRPYAGNDLKPSTAWHAQFEDVNNDGLADLFVAKGNVAEMPDFTQADPNNLVLQRADGTFMETGLEAGVASMAVSRGASLADFNLDGRLDLVVVNRWTGALVWRNTTVFDPAVAGHEGRHVRLRLGQDGPNRDAIGAWIEVRQGDRVLAREITSGGGHAGGHLGWIHVGIGAAEAAQLRVIWPDGSGSGWLTLPAGSGYRLWKGKEPERLAP
jgi:enediyne biosynthesis protein E4